MPDLLQEVIAAGKRIIEAQQKEDAARALYDANPAPETEREWSECRAETNRVFKEHQRLMQELQQRGSSAGGQ